MSYSLSKRAYLMVLLSIVMVVIFATIGKKNVLAGEIVRSFYIPSIFKQGTEEHLREITVSARYPGVIEADATWEPVERELTIMLYDQEGKPWQARKA